MPFPYPQQVEEQKKLEEAIKASKKNPAITPEKKPDRNLTWFWFFLGILVATVAFWLLKLLI